MHLRRRHKAWARLSVALLAVLVCASAEASRVTSSTQLHDYRVSGTTMSGLVGYMMSHPFPGDEGPALANIRPTYSLAIKTQDQGGVCRPTDVSLNIRFVMTLPKAVDASSLTGATKVAWHQFVAFARHPEETRRSIYFECGRTFIAKATQIKSSGSCFALRTKIQDAFAAAKLACDRKQLAYGRADDPRVKGLTLFASVRHSHH